MGNTQLRVWNKVCLGLLALLCLSLMACNPFLTKGYVVEKNDVPAHSHVSWHYISHTLCSGSGKSKSCSSYTTSYSTDDWIPEEWYLTLSSCAPGKSHMPDGQDCDQGSIQVSQSQYRRIRIHQYVDLNELE